MLYPNFLTRNPRKGDKTTAVGRILSACNMLTNKARDLIEPSEEAESLLS